MSMVEKVARAMLNTMNKDVRWTQKLPTELEAILIARAAIEAMREPTEGMREAGALEISDENSAFTQERDSKNAGYVFGAMIDAALAD